MKVLFRVRVNGCLTEKNHGIYTEKILKRILGKFKTGF